MLSDVVLAIQKTFSFYNLLVSLNKPSYNESTTDILFTWLLLRCRCTFFFLNQPNSVGSREPNETAKFRFNEVPLTDKVIAPDTAPGFFGFNHVGPWVRGSGIHWGYSITPCKWHDKWGNWDYFNPINGVLGPLLITARGRILWVSFSIL